MISERTIKELVEEKITGTGNFIVDIKVSSANKINILLDNDEGLKINDCVQVSRFVESNLNREVEDFELEVSSPDATQPFKVLRQYYKRKGKQVEVVTFEGKKITGILQDVNDDGITIEEKHRQKIQGVHGKQWVSNEMVFLFSQIKEAKSVISFK